jgi:hypothetical protein
MPGLTSEEMLEGYIPSPRLYITNKPIDCSCQHHSHLDYYDLSLTNDNSSSAWIRYNEQRINQLQQRIDLLLQIDDNEENQSIFSSNTVTQRIDDIIMKKSKNRNSTISYHKRIRKRKKIFFHLFEKNLLFGFSFTSSI